MKNTISDKLKSEDRAYQHRRLGLFSFSLLALVIGILTGFGAVAFRGLIAIIHNLFFLGEFSLYYDSNVFTPRGPWGPLIILAPVIGGLGVVFLVRSFAPEARGHGVPEVIYAIFYREGRIRPVVALVKALASALAIGSGAAVGREGPIIQIGSSVGSTIGQWLRLAPWQCITLVAAGAGAGIAATFNTPLGGVMFAIELMLPEVSTRTFVPVVISTAAATSIGRLFLGLQPAFIVPIPEPTGLEMVSATVLFAAAGLGVLCGVASWAFVRLLSLMEDLFERLPVNDYVRHAIGMALVGAVMYALFRGYGHYFIEGVGYATIQAILQRHLTDLALLALIFVTKLFATTTSLASGSSGGVFSPSLMLGATLGGAWGALMANLLPDSSFAVAEFAIIGMAAVVSGATGAALTAAVMIFEMTRDYNIMVPIVIAVAISVGIRRVLSFENIYTIKLARRGVTIPKERHSNMFLVRHANDIMDTAFAVMPETTALRDAIETLKETATKHVILTRDERIVAVMRLDPSLYALEEIRAPITLGEVADRGFTLLRENDTVFDTLKRMARHRVENALVIKSRIKGRHVPRAADIVGVISKDDIGNTVVDEFNAYRV